MFRLCMRLCWAVLLGVNIIMLVPSAAFPEEKQIAICHAGLITLPSFEQHIADLHQAKRFDEGRIERLMARKRKGGPDFFTSQIIIQENISGSGTYDLRLFHGISGAHTKYRNVTGWGCQGDDYPIVYFVGFRVREIIDSQIQVSREKDIVNVISVKKLDPDFTQGTSVKLFDKEQVLCRDIGSGCIDSVLYDRYDS